MNHIPLTRVRPRVDHYRLALAHVGHYWIGFGGRVGSARVSRYQHVGIPNARMKRGYCPTRGTNAVEYRALKCCLLSHNFKVIVLMPNENIDKVH